MRVSCCRLRSCRPEWVALLLRATHFPQALHALLNINVLHADLRPHNITLRTEAPPAALDSSELLGGPGWQQHGLAVIDFGRSIDLSLYPPATTFRGDAMADGYACTEMRRHRPWLAQARPRLAG